MQIKDIAHRLLSEESKKALLYDMLYVKKGRLSEYEMSYIHKFLIDGIIANSRHQLDEKYIMQEYKKHDIIAIPSAFMLSIFDFERDIIDCREIGYEIEHDCSFFKKKDVNLFKSYFSDTTDFCIRCKDASQPGWLDKLFVSERDCFKDFNSIYSNHLSIDNLIKFIVLLKRNVLIVVNTFSMQLELIIKIRSMFPNLDIGIVDDYACSFIGKDIVLCCIDKLGIINGADARFGTTLFIDSPITWNWSYIGELSKINSKYRILYTHEFNGFHSGLVGSFFDPSLSLLNKYDVDKLYVSFLDTSIEIKKDDFEIMHICRDLQFNKTRNDLILNLIKENWTYSILVVCLSDAHVNLLSDIVEENLSDNLYTIEKEEGCRKISFADGGCITLCDYDTFRSFDGGLYDIFILTNYFPSVADILKEKFYISIRLGCRIYELCDMIFDIDGNCPLLFGQKNKIDSYYNLCSNCFIDHGVLKGIEYVG